MRSESQTVKPRRSPSLSASVQSNGVHTGKEPRDFQILDDQYLIVACQGSNLLQIMTLNEDTEELVLTDSTVEIPAPVCIAFE